MSPISIIGISPWATRICGDIQLIARHATTVLVTGPSGTGKELIARSIHTVSDRSHQPFVPVDCAAASDTLFASQLFGHVKGAFTGAHHPSLGAFRAADRGTIFLDEIGELDLQLQAKLLRTLQQRTVVPVGSLQETPIDVRVVAATNRNLRAEVAAGNFREDLFYRLDVVSLETQPLHARREDIPLLVDAILARLQVQHGMGTRTVTPATMDLLRQHDWPGNVRELGNVLERAMLFSHDVIDVHHLPDTIQAAVAHSANVPPGESADLAVVDDDDDTWPTMDQVQRQHLERTLCRTNFNQSAAARLLKLDRNAVHRLAVRLGIERTPHGMRRPNDDIRAEPMGSLRSASKSRPGDRSL